MDVYQPLPDDYMSYLDGGNCEIYYLITSDVTPEERFIIQKIYDTEKDYTFHKREEEPREGCEYMIAQSRLMKEQCLPYYETARNREAVFERFMEVFSAARSQPL